MALLATKRANDWKQNEHEHALEKLRRCNLQAYSRVNSLYEQLNSMPKFGTQVPEDVLNQYQREVTDCAVDVVKEYKAALRDVNEILEMRKPVARRNRIIVQNRRKQYNALRQ